MIKLIARNNKSKNVAVVEFFMERRYINLKKLVVILLVSYSLSGFATVTTVPQSRMDLAKTLISLDGSAQSMQEANKVVIQQMKQNLPYAPNGFFTRLQQRFNQVDYNSQLANIYAETLSEEELKKLIELYSSPVGKSIANKTGDLSKKLAEQQAHITEEIIQKTSLEFGQP